MKRDKGKRGKRISNIEQGISNDEVKKDEFRMENLEWDKKRHLDVNR